MTSRRSGEESVHGVWEEFLFQVAPSIIYIYTMKTEHYFNFIELRVSFRKGYYSRTPLTRTLKGNEKLFELAGVRVNEGGVKFRLLG